MPTFLRRNSSTRLACRTRYTAVLRRSFQIAPLGIHASSEGWENAPFLSLTQPYSAGALMSTVDDSGVVGRSGRVAEAGIRRLRERAFGGFKLTNGEQTHYGYGWQLDDYAGRKLIHHGGGIPGYASETLRMS